MLSSLLATASALAVASSSAVQPCPDSLGVRLTKLGFSLAAESEIESVIHCTRVSGTESVAFAAVIERRVDNPDFESLAEYDLLVGLAGTDGGVTSPTIHAHIGDNSGFFLTATSLQPVGNHYGAPAFLVTFTSRNNSQVSYATVTEGLLLRFTPQVDGISYEPKLLPLTRRFAVAGLTTESGSEACSSATAQLTHEIVPVAEGQSVAITRRSRSTSSGNSDSCEERVEQLGARQVSVPTTTTWIEIPDIWEGESAGEALP